MEHEERELIGDLTRRLESFQHNATYQLVLSIQRKARLYEQKVQMQYRTQLLQHRLSEKHRENKIEQAKLGILRAEKAKTTENIHALSGKAIEADARITSIRTEIRETKQTVVTIETESITTGKQLLAGYFDAIKGEAIVNTLSKATPVIRANIPTVKCSSKSRKQFEENSIIAQCHQISRFFNVASSTFRHPLRFATSSLFVVTHRDLMSQNGTCTYEHVQFLDERAAKFIQANLFHLESCKLIKKMTSLESFLKSSKLDQLQATPQHHQITNHHQRPMRQEQLRSALFQTRKTTKKKTHVDEFGTNSSDIPDLT